MRWRFVDDLLYFNDWAGTHMSGKRITHTRRFRLGVFFFYFLYIKTVIELRSGVDISLLEFLGLQ